MTWGVAGWAAVPVQVLGAGCTSKTLRAYLAELWRGALGAGGGKRSSVRRVLGKLAFWKK